MNSEPYGPIEETSSSMDLFVNEARLGVRLRDGVLTIEQSPHEAPQDYSQQRYAQSAERARDLTREIGLRFPGAGDRKSAPALHRQGGGILVEFARRLLGK